MIHLMSEFSFLYFCHRGTSFSLSSYARDHLNGIEYHHVQCAEYMQTFKNTLLEDIFLNWHLISQLIFTFLCA